MTAAGEARARAASALALWREVVTGLVRADDRDLTQRQFALLLHVYTQPPPHTVRALAAALAIPKPAVSRGLDVLARAGLVKRMRDTADRRDVHAARTVAGAVYLRDLADRIVATAEGHGAIIP